MQQEINEKLLSAAKRGDVIYLDYMVSCGADVNYKNKYNSDTAIGVAIENRQLECVRYLLDNGVDISKTFMSNNNLLHQAILYGQTEIAKYLIEKGVNIEAKNADGHSPLSLATFYGVTDIADLITSLGQSKKEFDSLNKSIKEYHRENNFSF